MLKEIKVSDFIEAVEKNGYPWIRMNMYDPDTNSSCALGQAVRNLGYDPDVDRSLFLAIANGLGNTLLFKYGLSVTQYNDSIASTYEDIIDWVKKRFSPYADETITLIYWQAVNS